MIVARMVIALGAFVWLLHGAAALAQMTGSWRPTPPNSKAIVYDEKGRRLFWDDNGQIVGRYSFATGRYIAELPGEQRPEKSTPRKKPNSLRENQDDPSIAARGQTPRVEAEIRSRPNVVSTPTARPPTVRRFGQKRAPTAVVMDRSTRPDWVTSVEPPGTP